MSLPLPAPDILRPGEFRRIWGPEIAGWRVQSHPDGHLRIYPQMSGDVSPTPPGQSDPEGGALGVFGRICLADDVEALLNYGIVKRVRR